MKRVFSLFVLLGVAACASPPQSNLVPAASPALHTLPALTQTQRNCHTRSATYTPSQLWNGEIKVAHMEVTYRKGYGFFGATVTNNLTDSQVLVTWGTGRPGGAHYNSGHAILARNAAQTFTFTSPVRHVGIRQRHRGLAQGSGVQIDVQSCHK